MGALGIKDAPSQDFIFTKFDDFLELLIGIYLLLSTVVVCFEVLF